PPPHRWPRQRQQQAQGRLTRSSANWSVKPGSYDALHCERAIWPSEEGAYVIPALLPPTFDLPPDFRLLPYRSRLDRLDIGARHVAGYFATLTPDFSRYPDWPLAAQLWNTYRSHAGASIRPQGLNAHRHQAHHITR
ncbi:MAG: DUF4417 domain-containing protein, partial [Lamprobacter sp.]|uniref:DUF4417 domain-containing protein n=1 Tax=Lamprobacter sp. TaxID=3100796 RepID=UPI002B25800C